MNDIGKKLWEEFVRDTQKIDLGALSPKNELISGLWDENKRLDPEVAQKLLKIAHDFFDSIKLGDKSVKIDDITITGSAASYNWSEYSDIDLHILVNYENIDENIDLVREFFRGKIFVWNQKHEIELFGHEVEIYVQDTNEPHHSLGVYSVLNDQWIAEPLQNDPQIDLNGVKNKATMLMDCIDRIIDLFEDGKYKKSRKCGEKMKEKIKKMRKTGLDEGGIYSIENLSFKILRRNGYLADLNEIIDKSYDKMQSFAKDFVKKLKIYVSEPNNEENQGFHAINELEKFQKRLKRRHSRMKKRLIGRGKQRNVPPYTRKPGYKRAKSAPPGAGGT